MLVLLLVLVLLLPEFEGVADTVAVALCAAGDAARLGLGDLEAVLLTVEETLGGTNDAPSDLVAVGDRLLDGVADVVTDIVGVGVSDGETVGDGLAAAEDASVSTVLTS